MIIIYIIICIIYLVLIIWSRRKECDVSKVSTTVLRPFYRIAYQIYDRILRVYERKHKNFPAILASKKVRSDLNTLNPTGNAEQQEKQFYIEKLSMVLLILCLATGLGICSTVSSLTSSVLQEQNRIRRSTYGGGQRAVSLLATVGEEGIENTVEVEITAKVGEQIYSYDTFLEKAEEMLMQFPELILGENTSLQEISTDLNLVRSVEGYPFELTWESSNEELLRSDGELVQSEKLPQGDGSLQGGGELPRDKESNTEGSDVTLYLTISYEDYELKKRVTAHVLSVQERLTRTELLQRQIEQAIAEQDELTREEEYLRLPTEIEGNEIVWTEHQEDNGLSLLLLGLIGGVVYYLWKDHELHERVTKREQKLIRDYPELISKLTLLLSAGMTMRGAWFRLVSEYQDKQKKEMDCVYAEMLITCHEMEEGISELKAYSNFGKRCGSRRYLRFSAIITQNLKRGSSRLLSLLTEEAEATFEERKNNARKMGEEAGTKLLIPMMLMLVVVMVVIMVPAFISFA